MDKNDIILDLGGDGQSKFGGIDLKNSKHSLAVNFTDDEQNLIGNGSFLRKRPGSHLLQQIAGEQDKIYDMKRGALAAYDNLKTTNDSLMMILSNNSNYDEVRSYRIAVGTVQGLGIVGRAGANLVNGGRNDRRLELCSDRFFLSNNNVIDTQEYYWNVGCAQSGYDYTLNYSDLNIELYSAPVWHRNHMFLARSFNALYPSRVRFSDFNSPLTFPVNNYVDINPTGRVDTVLGMATDGDRLYISKPKSIWMLTGATAELFSLERISNSPGFMGVRSMTQVDENLVGFSIEPGSIIGNTSAYERYAPRGIFTISRGNVTNIGDNVAPILNSFLHSTVNEPRVKYKEDDKIVIMLPDVSLTSQDTVGIVLDTVSNTWHKWSFNSSFGGYNNQPVCMEYAPGWEGYPVSTTYSNKLYMATRTGGLFWLDADHAVDDTQASAASTPPTLPTPRGSNTITSYWTSCWLSGRNAPNYKSAEYAWIQGYQKSGGQATLSIAKDYENTFKVIRTFDLREEGQLVTLSGLVGSARSYKIKIQFADDGVQSEIRRVVLSAKPFGEI